MFANLSFFQSEHGLAFIVAFFVFLITILLVVKRWIGFSVTLLLLIFSLAAGVIINYQQHLHNHLTSSNPLPDSSIDFHQHVLQALEDLKVEVAQEKQNLHRLTSQVQDISHSIDIQKQNLQNFIEETHQHFQSNDSLKSSSPALDASATISSD